MQSGAIKVVDALVLMVKSFMQDTALQALRLKHAGHKGLELDITVVQFTGHRAGQLYLDGLEAGGRRSA